MSKNRIIGRDGSLPWHLPGDLRRFKRLTVGHTLVMGRRTFDSIGRALPQRRSIVLSRDPAFQPPDVEIARTLEQALMLMDDSTEVFVIGGNEIYRLFLPHAQRIYLTVVEAVVAGDTRFPDFNETEWVQIEQQHQAADADDPFIVNYLVYQRRESADHPAATAD